MFIKMRPFFFLLVITCLTLTVAARGSERVEVESGKSVNLSFETPVNVRRVTLGNCETTGQPIILYCCPEEEKNGCSAEKSDTFSIRVNSGSFSVTLVDARASDEGCYRISYIDFANISKDRRFTVKVLEPPSSTIDPSSSTIGSSSSTIGPPSSTIGPPSSTISPPSSTISTTVGIAVGTAAVILAIIGVYYIIKCLKRKKNNARGDPLEIASLSSASSGATGESTKMVDETESPVDNNSQQEEEWKKLNHDEKKNDSQNCTNTKLCGLTKQLYPDNLKESRVINMPMSPRSDRDCRWGE